MHDVSLDAVETLISVFIPALVFVIGLGSTAVLSIEFWGRIKEAAAKVRKHVDQADDPLIKALEIVGELVTKDDINPAELSAVLTALVDQIKAHNA